MTECTYMKCGNEFLYQGVIFNGYSTPEQLDETCRFNFLPNDIIISTFPRSGTQLAIEIVWQIKNRSSVIKGQIIKDVLTRSPFLEFNYKCMNESPRSYCDILDSQINEPYRLIKTHVPYEFIQKNFEKVNPKMIVVMRNAKDCLVSNYHHYHHPVHEWNGNFDDFFPIFLHEKTYSGSYFENNLTWWSLRERDNILVVFYEDLVTDLTKGVQVIGEFLGETLTEEDIEKIVYNSSFSTMIQNPEHNYTVGGKFRLMRKGIVGNWKGYLSELQNRLLDAKIEEKFSGSGIQFKYE